MTYFKALTPMFQGYVDDVVPMLIERAERHLLCFDIDDELEEAFAGFVLAYGSDALRKEPEEGDDFDSRRAAFLRDLIVEMLRLSDFHGVMIPEDNVGLALSLGALVSPGRTPDEEPVYVEGRIVGYENRATGAVRYRIGKSSIKR